MSPGARIRMLRIILGISREDFCITHTINLNTFISIELDRLKISKKQMNKIIQAFEKEGIYVDELWIMHAKGTPPTRLLTHVEQHNNSFLEKWANFFSNNRHAVITHVKGDTMEPFYTMGDLVGGIWHTVPHLLLGKRCIVQLNNTHLTGILFHHNDMFSLVPANTTIHHGHTIFPGKEAKVAEILWHIRKNSHQIPELSSLEVCLTVNH